jgi:hypothetical protein
MTFISPAGYKLPQGCTFRVPYRHNILLIDISISVVFNYQVNTKI